jgi:hypothetical protein
MEFDAVVVVVWFVMADIKRIHPIGCLTPNCVFACVLGGGGVFWAGGGAMGAADDSWMTLLNF